MSRDDSNIRFEIPKAEKYPKVLTALHQYFIQRKMCLDFKNSERPMNRHRHRYRPNQITKLVPVLNLSKNVRPKFLSKKLAFIVLQLFDGNIN